MMGHMAAAINVSWYLNPIPMNAAKLIFLHDVFSNNTLDEAID
jgi:hypothetical protein